MHEHEIKAAQAANYTNSGRGSALAATSLGHHGTGGGGGSAGQIGQDREPTLAEQYLSRLDEIAQLLVHAIEQQEQFIGRVHGPRPSDPQGKEPNVQPQGAHANIELRLRALNVGMNRALENQYLINKIA